MPRGRPSGSAPECRPHDPSQLRLYPYPSQLLAVGELVVRSSRSGYVKSIDSLFFTSITFTLMTVGKKDGV